MTGAEQGPQPHVRRAYGALLGNYYEQRFYDHIKLSAAADAFATDFEKAMEWQRAAVEEAARLMPPNSFQPILITDKGSAFLDVDDFYRVQTSIHQKIAQFADALGATFVVVSYASSGGDRKYETFFILGTNGWTAHETRFLAARKLFGSPSVQLSEDKEMQPWESSFLGEIARALRENQDAAAGERTS